MLSSAPSKLKTSLTSGLASLGVVYIIWSTTYLAIRIAVAPGNGFPPFAMGTARLFAAFILLILIAKFSGKRLRLTRREVLVAAITGLLLWVGGNGLVNWAEQSANSGFAALMVASDPIWVVALNAVLLRRLPSPLLITSLVFGFTGVAVLMAPSIIAGDSTNLIATLALLIAALSWAIGSVYQTRRQISTSVLVLSAYQHLFGALGTLVMSILLHESFPHPTGSAWLAWGYLVLFGSVLAYTCFIRALKLLPINLVMTYSYVNPVLALLLGWWVLNEKITIFTGIGAIMVLLGVVGTFSVRHPKPSPAKVKLNSQPSI
ncbi:MAG: EamA family transporter [Methanomassiliicoccales archaeon]